VARIARVANAPIVPAAIIGTDAYRRLANWAPLRGVRYGIAFGPAIHVSDEAQAERELAEAYKTLYGKLRERLPDSITAVPGAEALSPRVVAAAVSPAGLAESGAPD
jgi:1-acyl-sn-glycerol-3-phosphate acyltransferase